MRRLAALATCFACAAFTTCGPAPAPLPPIDVCAQPAAPTAPFTLELSGPADAFVPWTDGAAVSTILGGQGSDMLAVRARLVAASVPGCIGLTVRVTIAGVNAGERTGVVATYPDGAGRATKPLYIELYNNVPGAQATVAATVGDVTLTRTLVLDP